MWRTALPWLRRAYRDACAYLGMRILPATGAATVDHYKPKSKHQRLAYEWSNLRLASQLVNTFKDEHEDVLDPFEIENGWFVLKVGSFEVAPAPNLDDDLTHRVLATIERLKLNEPTFCDARAEWHDDYLGLSIDPLTGAAMKPTSFDHLRRDSPFVAAELARQGRLRPGDAPEPSA